MIERATVYLEKAQESVAGAQSELANARYNNAANRAYYACFQAAIHALNEAGIQPPRATDRWGHGFVQARFHGDLIGHRKRYPAELRVILEHTFRLRQTADYHRRDHVTEVQAARAARQAETFVAAVTRAGGRQR